jgi:hypothetical protein
MLGIQNNPNCQLEKYLIVCYLLPLGLLEQYAVKEVMGQ